MNAGLRPLQIGDKGLFEAFLCSGEHVLSVYAFPNIYIWKGLFDISWIIIDGCLCVFFRDAAGCFMYLPPLGEKQSACALDKAFAIMADCNKNPAVSRIENVEDKDLAFYKERGYECVLKSYDYLCKTDDIADLRGDKFKSKRAAVNYFEKHYAYEYRVFVPGFRNGCIDLYERWMNVRAQGNKGAVYEGMMRDSLNALKIFLDEYPRLGCEGRIVLINKEVKAFTFGFPVCRKVFCVLYEIADFSVKGSSQFIFRKFCGEMREYTRINVMDDSGLENLKRVKLSYRPVSLIPAYNILRPA